MKEWNTLSNNPIPQLGAAMALTQLLQEHPELPPAAWRISDKLNALEGNLHGRSASFDVLRWYADVLGGSIRAGHDFESGGRMLRSHLLTTVWRDVRVEVHLYLPLHASLAVTV